MSDMRRTQRVHSVKVEAGGQQRQHAHGLHDPSLMHIIIISVNELIYILD